jgi:type I restriction enzyme R subunit
VVLATKGHRTARPAPSTSGRSIGSCRRHGRRRSTPTTLQTSSIGRWWPRCRCRPSAKEEAVKAARDSGLSTRAFGVFWTLKDDQAVRDAGISSKELATEAELLLARFPNATVNADEHRKLRAALYRPLLDLGKEDRGRIVDVVLSILLDDGSDAAS